VSMDQITVDVTELEVVQPGDPVVLVGRQGAVEQDAEDVAGQAGTISYDILTGLMPRVPRVYVERGAVMAVSTSQRPSTKTIEAISPGTVRLVKHACRCFSIVVRRIALSQRHGHRIDRA